VQPVHPTFVGGVYWRQSMINGAKTVPAILTLYSGRLALSAQAGPAFDAWLQEVSISISKLSTMTLQVGGHKYAIVGRGSQISPAFSPEQVQQLGAAYQAGANPAPGQPPVVVVGATVTPDGSVDVVNIHNGPYTGNPVVPTGINFGGLRERIGLWQQVFASLGIPT